VGERRIRGQHHGGGANALVRGIDARRRRAIVQESLGRAQQTPARHDDALVRGDEIFARAVDDRTHAFLQEESWIAKPATPL